MRRVRLAMLDSLVGMVSTMIATMPARQSAARFTLELGASFPVVRQPTSNRREASVALRSHTIWTTRSIPRVVKAC
jgi:hypothetical protein